jgi:hypothetical protein
MGKSEKEKRKRTLQLKYTKIKRLKSKYRRFSGGGTSFLEGGYPCGFLGI